MGNINSQLSGIGHFTNSAANYGTATRGIFVGNTYNYGTILSTANFSSNSNNSGIVLSAATFTSTATNNGYLSSTASFSDTSINNGVISISATFSGQSNNSAIVPIAIFSGNSVNDDTGSVAQATFANTSTNAGSAVIASFRDTTINNGVVTTSAVFLSGATNAFGATVFSAVFSGISVNQGTALSATFNLSSTNNGTITNTATFLDRSLNSNLGSVFGTCILSGFSTNAGVILSATFGENSTNTGTVSSVTFQSSAINNGTIINNATFLDKSSNSVTGYIVATPIFSGFSTNAGSLLSAVFGGYSTNTGTITGATFNATSTNKGLALSAVFGGTSTNTGTISSAVFGGKSTNTGSIGSATFNENSVNTGTIAGNVTFNGSSINNGGIIIGNITLPPRDSFYHNVLFLVNGDMDTLSIGNSAITDSSFNNLTVTNTASSLAIQSNFSPYSTFESATYFNGSTTYALSSNLIDALSGIGKAKHTIEMWIYPTAFNNSANGYRYGLLSNFHGVTTNGRLSLHLTSNAAAVSASVTLQYTTSTGTVDINTTSTTPVVVNKWNHIALVIDPITTSSSAARVEIFVNGISRFLGTSENLSTQTFIFNGPAQLFSIGSGIGVVNNTFTGYISNFRWTKNQTLYSSNFTPSFPLTLTSQNALSSNVLLLTFKELKKARNLGVTPGALAITGTHSVSAIYSPGITGINIDPYNSIVHGGSIGFSGTTGKLTLPSVETLTLSTLPFTIDCWIYPTATVTEGTIIRLGNTYDFWLMVDANVVRLDLQPAGSTVVRLGNTAAASAPVGEWTHVAVVREANNLFKLYINGLLVSSGTQTVNLSGSTPGTIGVLGTSLQPGGTAINPDTKRFAGYISDLRIAKGQTIYTREFILPSTALQPTTNDTLLLSFTNANLTDKSTLRPAVTATGEVSLDTRQGKYRNQSIYFGSNGGYLTAPSNTEYFFGLFNFTIEWWQCLTADLTAGYGPCISFSPNISTRGGWVIWRDTVISNTRMTISIAGSSGVGRLNLSTTITPSVSVWQHWAVVRNGSTMTWYCDGVACGSTATANVNITDSILSTLNVGLAQTWGYTARNIFLDDVRITKGVARYTTNFTPPTATLPLRGQI